MSDNGNILEIVRQIHDRVLAIDQKLDSKSDKDDCLTNTARLTRLEEKTSNINVKIAGFSGVVSGLLLALKHLVFPGTG